MRAVRFLWIPVIAVFLLAVPAPSSAQVAIGFTIGQPPPPLPVYNSIPPAPYQNAMWTPGYWSYGPAGYYWVPGTWVQPPQTGLYWTPGYWGYNNGGYGFNNGYWAPQVGFYGGINYGFGYPGTGFYGGQWQPSGFSYNTAAWPVNQTVIHNTYVNRTVINKTVINRTSYNGGRGGVIMRPDSRQLQVMREHHVQATSAQVDHVRAAERDRNQYASVNKGKPDQVSAAKPYNAKNPPPNAKPVTDQDKTAAKGQQQNSTSAQKNDTQKNNTQNNNTQKNNTQKNNNPPKNNTQKNNNPPKNENQKPPQQQHNNNNQNPPQQQPQHKGGTAPADQNQDKGKKPPVR